MVGRGQTLPFNLGLDRIVHQVADRRKNKEFLGLFKEGADLVVDLIAYTKDDAKQLLSIQKNTDMLAVLSSSSVYVDDQGRSLDEASINGFPEFTIPIKETNRTVEPGTETYSANKAAMERTLLESSDIPVKILRPGAIYGKYSHHAREWWFVKRMLDKREKIPLAYGGESRFHTTSASNIANVLLTSLANPGNMVINVADKEALTVLAMGKIIATQLNYGGEFITLSEKYSKPFVGFTPWSVPRPFVLETSVSENLLEPISLKSYEESVCGYYEWLKTVPLDNDWKNLFPQLANYPYDHFNYVEEDLYFSSQH